MGCTSSSGGTYTAEGNAYVQPERRFSVPDEPRDRVHSVPKGKINVTVAPSTFYP